MKDNEQQLLIFTYLRRKRSRERTAENHLQVSIPLVRAIPMESGQTASPPSGGLVTGVFENSEY